MKSKVNILKILVLIVFVFCIGFVTNNVKAAETNNLIQINGNTITKTTKISQINSMLGKYKIETDSAFGGKMYSYYDDNYTWYLAVETDANGNIKGYGAIGGDFVARRYAYDDVDDSSYWYLSGTVIKDWDYSKVYAIYEYNCTSSDATNYWSEYQKDSSKYLYGLQQHSAVASKVLATRDGYEFPQIYSNEDVFYTGEQLKYNGSNYYEYAQNTGRTNAIRQISMRTNTYYQDLPNPINLGKMTEGYVFSSAYQYALYDVEITNYYSKNGYVRLFYIDPTFLAERKTIDLTQDEKTKLELVLEQYELYKQHGEAITDVYDEDPNYTSLPLVAGKYNENVLLHVTDYINMARVGIGMGTLTLNEDIADAAQHKAVLVRYMNSIGLTAGHFPTQPEGVSDEFYNKAQSYMNENLYSGSILTSINNALNDAYGDPITCGHRYNLLYPGYTQWGAGCAGVQGAHKFSGSTTINTELVAWPSNGIFPLDMVYSGIGNWTAQFYKNYSVTSDTEVTVKCLNTDKTYEITHENKDESDKNLVITGNSLVTFRDDNITYEDGDVFEITLHNVKNSRNESVDYTYRSVFTSLYQLDSVKASDITLSQTNVSMAVGQSKRVYATIAPEDTSNKLMKFKSLNEDIVTVRQDGTIKALSTGNAKIKVTCSDIEKIINVTVNSVIKGDLNKDGIVNSADAAKALVLYKYNNPTDEELAIGDMNDDGLMNSADAAKILNIYKYGY